MKMKKMLLFGFLLGILFCKAQSNDYWQQHVDYKMDVKIDVKSYQYKGKQELLYNNNSQDTLKKSFLPFIQ